MTTRKKNSGELLCKSVINSTVTAFIVVSVLIILFAFIRVPVLAEDSAEDSGVCTDGSVSYTWQLEGSEVRITAVSCEDERYELNFPAEIEGHPVTSIPWDDCLVWNEKVTAISLPDGVTAVPDSAFRYTPNLVSVNVNESNPGLTVRDGVLFNKDLTQLLVYPSARAGTDYDIPERVTSLKWYAFCNTQFLENVRLSSGIREYSDNFTECESLRSLDLNMLSRVNGSQFNYSPNIERITVSENNTYLTVYDNALYSYGNYWDYNDKEMTLSYYPAGRDDETVTIPDEVYGRPVTCIMNSALSCSRFSEIHLPDGLVRLGGRAFECCQNLESVIVPEGTEIVGSNAFLFCDSLKYIYIPESATDLADLLSGVPEGAAVYGIPGSAAEAYINDLYDPDTWPYDPDSGYTFRNIEEEKIPQDITLCDESLARKITAAEDGTSQLKLDLNDGSADLSARARKGVVYTCDKPGVAEIGEDGKLTLKSKGEAKIVLTAAVAEGDERYYAPTSMQIMLNVWDSKNPEPQNPDPAADKEQQLKATRIKAVTSAKPSLKCKAGKRRVKLSWNRVSNATGYQIFVRFPGKSKYKKVLTTSGKVKSVTHKDLRKGKKYKYKIRAFIREGGKTYYSKFSKVKTVKVRQ